LEYFNDWAELEISLLGIGENEKINKFGWIWNTKMSIDQNFKKIYIFSMNNNKGKNDDKYVN